MMKTRLMVFSQQDVFEFEISPNDVFSAPWREGINREHSLSIVTTVKLRKGQRILYKDKMEKWHEYVVYGQDDGHENDERPFGTYPCVWSLQNDFELFTVNDIPGLDDPINARDALEVILSETNRWKIGRVEISTLAGADMTRVSGWEALSLLVENWGGEIDTEIEVGNNGVVSRKVSVYDKIGSQEAKRRFDYSSDLLSIHRKVEEMPLACRIRPLGKTEKDVDGFDVHITIEDANDGIDYLQNDQMAEILKMPYTRKDGTVGYEYPIINVENTEIEDPEELLEWGLSVLEEYTTPKVTYSMDVLQLSTAGADEYGVSLGDMVQSVDRGFSEDGVRISVRVISIEGDLVDDSNMRLTMGNATDTYILSVSKAVRQVEKFTFGARTTAQYLDNLLTQLNGQINATGGYTYIVPGHGMITYDKAVSDPLVGDEATALVEIKGGSIRIGNRPTAQDDWDYRTVFVSGHIAADLVTAAQITSGYMRSANGNVYIDLDDGKYMFSGLMSNLVSNGDFMHGFAFWSSIDATVKAEDDERFLKRLKVTTSSVGGYDCRIHTNRLINFEHEVGKTYSLSFWARSDSANTVSANCGGYDAEGQSYVYRQPTSTEWQRYTGTITAEGAYALSILVGSPGTVYLANVCLTLGENPQEWSPSKLDVSGYRDLSLEAAKTATNYLTFNPSTGLDVGYVGSQSKTRIDGEGVEIFDGEGDSVLYAGLVGTYGSQFSRVRVGKESETYSVVGAGMFEVINYRKNALIMHVGYDEGMDTEQDAPSYYTFGTRLRNSTKGNQSLSVGSNNTCSGQYAVTIGYMNTASKDNSIAIGTACNTSTGGNNAVVIGTGLRGCYDAFVCGKYNEVPAIEVQDSSQEYIFVVGTGTYASPRNGLVVQKNGNTTIDGTVIADDGVYASSMNITSSLSSLPPIMTKGTATIESTCTAREFVTNSDRRLKEHVCYMDEEQSSEFIRSLKPAMFKWKKEGEALHMGFYAQDVKDADMWGTSAVIESEVGFGGVDNPLSVNYQAIIAPLVAYAQSLERRIIELEQRIGALEDRA